MIRARLLLFAAIAIAALPFPVARAEEQAPLIPRDVLFGNPDRAAVRLSPDGTAISFLAAVDGVMNVWVGPLSDPDAARAVTADKGRGIRRYHWCHDGRRMLYLQDEGGNENWRLFVLDLVTLSRKALTPADGSTARIEELSHKHPRHVLVSLNDRDPRHHDVYKIDLVTGTRELVMKNEGFLGFGTDDDYNIRFAARPTPQGGTALLRKDAEGAWKPFLEAGQQDALTTQPLGFDKSGRLLYLKDSRGRNTAALTILDLETGEQTLLAEDERADIAGVSFHPTEKYLQAVSVNYLRNEWNILDKKMARDFEILRKVDSGDLNLTSRTLDDRHWIVVSQRDDGPVRYYHFDRDVGKARFLFTNRKSLEGVTLSHMKPVVVKARDGLDLVCYLTLPPGIEGKPKKPLPMTLLVHGGPWGRDSWGYNPLHQMLANRGYAVLSVNFRGSTGFGKKFINAADFEWGRKMHDDLLDAVDWAVKDGIADEKRVAIMGGSYGGYATLVGVTMTPDKFACGVDIVGPSNLITLLNTIPPYWAPMINLFTSRVGDHRTEEGRKLLTERSPLTHVDNIKRPLLIGQGKNDPRVKESEAQQIVDAMKARKIPVTYVLYPDEGHGFRKPANMKSFFAVVEAFLSEVLGGRCQPMGQALEGSSIQVPHGAQWVPGLSDALGAR